jgi:hypothetical protein
MPYKIKLLYLYYRKLNTMKYFNQKQTDKSISIIQKSLGNDYVVKWNQITDGYVTVYEVCLKKDYDRWCLEQQSSKNYLQPNYNSVCMSLNDINDYGDITLFKNIWEIGGLEMSGQDDYVIGEKILMSYKKVGNSVEDITDRLINETNFIQTIKDNIDNDKVLISMK